MLTCELFIPINISLCKKVKNRTNPIIGIYKIISHTGKINIGQSTDIENRFHKYNKLHCKNQKRLYHSLKKHGVENHRFEIIHIFKKNNLSKSEIRIELNRLEINYIKLFNCYVGDNHEFGLNLTRGGDGSEMTEISRKKLSESLTNKLFLQYNECKEWIKNNTIIGIIKSASDWYKLNKNKLPNFIPKDPPSVYKIKGDWKGWGDFLGTGNKKGRNYKKPQYFYTYEESKKWIKNNKLTKNIKSIKEWDKIKNKLPYFIPKDPTGYYTRQGTWKGCGDFLGTGRKSKGDFLSYQNTKKWVQENLFIKNIKTQKEWYKITKKLPSFIPKDPPSAYKKEWKGWGDFLGTGKKLKGDFLNYNDAKKWIQNNPLTINLKSSEWKKITNKLPLFIPKNPPQYYIKKGEWKDWCDFLGTGNKHKGDFLSYEEAKKWVQNNILTKDIKSQKEWGKITKKLPLFIPKHPQGYYPKQGTWKGMRDFLGTNNKRRINKNKKIKI